MSNCVQLILNQRLLLVFTAVGIVLYQPQNIIFVPAGGSVDISCISNTTSVLNDLSKIFWYRKTWKDGDMLTRVASCVTMGPQTNPCRQDTSGFTITLYNIQAEDSGMYYCSHLHLRSLFFANGTTLIITGDNSDGINIGYLMITSQQPTPNSTIQLACVVRALHTGHVTWNISGTRHMGRRTSVKLSNGTWNILNLLSLSRDTWDYGDTVTCEVWFSSSIVQIHWTIPHKVENEEN
ncbi:uncharacterized protein LOC120920081 [Rana temporaria]|uniref:uncharacterized protein LOC120920081 n=1 Tax=Rana temporaria TaxID=8407 RepID=UPI001AAD537E|nr:uncharacterized protein LOC120920081 [Rana temporaria]